MPSTDQLLKELLRQFLPGFMRLFFPDAAAQIAWERGVTFRDKELFTDFPEGKLREADLVAEVFTLVGTPELILVHIEVQGQRKADFSARMWEYFALIRLRTGLPVFPLVLHLSPGDGGITREEYTEDLLGERLLTFRYGAVNLPELSADDYLNETEPVGWALASGMRPGSAGRARLKFETLRRIAQSSVDDARTGLLGTVIETLLPLNRRSDRERFAELLASEPSGAEVRQVYNIFEERGEQRGIIRGQQVFLTRMLRTKFGELSADVEARVAAISKQADLERLADKLLTAQSLEELGLLPGQPQ